MKTFAYLRAADVNTALQSITSEPRAKFLAGGTNLVDLMREGIERPDTVIDITRLPLDGIEELVGGRVSAPVLRPLNQVISKPSGCPASNSRTGGGADTAVIPPIGH